MTSVTEVPGSRRSHSRSAIAAAVMALLAGLLAWLWPIGIGGKMPVGGDVTQFFLGLMGFLGESLRAGRLPIWNDSWGFGFPGLAESQMGVFYPAHLILYRWLGTETAYVASLVLHTLWGGLGAFWTARRLDISNTGSALAALSWSTCGFFVIHLAHQWGYTTGCWMPWAWGLTLCCLGPTGCFRKVAPFLLSVVLVLQLLPGHFQLAFMTQLVIVLIVIWSAVERWGGRGLGALPVARSPFGFRMLGAGAVALALLGAFPLAAIQLWPTARLAKLAAGQRDFGYLSGFAATPFHMVNFVAPGFFHRSSLWRPLVWDPFHTSPEELLPYVGLAPLFLAAVALLRRWRVDPIVRLLAIVFFITTLLGLGPYLPGFRHLIRLPGFNFFRAPSRWLLPTSLALALLAGKGFDGWADWPRPGRSLQRFSLAALVAILAVAGLIELALLSTTSQGWPTLARGFQLGFDAMPWKGDPSFAAVMAGARGPAVDPRIPAGLNRSRFLQSSDDGQSFADARGSIYVRELGEAAALLAVLWVIGRLSEGGRMSAGTTRWLLVAVTFLDLWILGRHRLLDVAPLKPLVEQSPVLATIAREPHGTRIAGDRLKNMPMLVGQAPISAYRTLDLPAVPELTSLAHGPLSAPTVGPLVRSALRATGVGVRVLDPIENRKERLLGHAAESRELIDDPALASWLFGASWVADLGPWARTFVIWRAPVPPVRAWLVPVKSLRAATTLDHWSGDVRELLGILDAAEPLVVHSARPEEWTISVQVKEDAWVILSQLADPQWQARWVGEEGQPMIHGNVLPAFRKESQPGGWQCLAVPPSGHWTLRLEYDARDVAEGAAISLVAWLSWVLAAFSTVFLARRGRAMAEQAQIERGQT
jgi:hypothetical protein